MADTSPNPAMTAPAVPSDTPPALHVGYHKCASTTLQRTLFARHPQIVNLDAAGDVSGREPIRRAARHAHIDPARREEADLDQAARAWRDVEAQIRARGQLPLYSWENLTRDFYFRTPTDDRLPAALKAVVGDARIVVIVRHQIELLESLYLSRMKPPNYQTPHAWLDDEGARTACAYRYADVIGTYASVFGEANVLVQPFEEIATDPAAVERKICTHIGVNPALGRDLLKQRAMNRRPSAAVHAYARFRQAVLPSFSFGKLLPRAANRAVYRMLSSGKGATVTFPTERLAEWETVYREQNRRLADRFGLDLERFRYPL